VEKQSRSKNSATEFPLHGFDQAMQAAKSIQTHGVMPKVAITLGSGLEEVANRFPARVKIPYERIPGFPLPAVRGHDGTLHLGDWNGLQVAILAGRAHGYEGHTPAAVVFPIRALALAGVETFILTCAGGGIASKFRPGDFMVFSGHLNLQGANPLAGSHDSRWGTQFVDLTEAYDPGLRATALNAARKLRARCLEGVYASLPGPSYETPAEILALRKMGADAVGMSTVPEVLVARQAGRRVLAIAVITNRAAGLAREPLRHEDVLGVGRAATSSLTGILDRILSRLDKAGRRS
jgi:purine-nucleoside phosphorylase